MRISRSGSAVGEWTRTSRNAEKSRTELCDTTSGSSTNGDRIVVHPWTSGSGPGISRIGRHRARNSS